jgi:hypothetical protein
MPDELVRGVPPGLQEQIEARLTPNYRIEAVAVIYDDLGMQLDLEIAGRTPPSEELAEQLRQLIGSYYDEPIRVRVATRLEIRVRTTNGPGAKNPSAETQHDSTAVDH